VSADVEALTEVLLAFEGASGHMDYMPWYRDMARRVLDALPEMLRADGAAGDALRERLGLADAIREARVAALYETTKAWQYKGWAEVFIPMPNTGLPSLAAGQGVTEWLRARTEQENGR